MNASDPHLSPDDARPPLPQRRPSRRRDDIARDQLFDMSADLLCVASFEGWLLQVNPAWTRTLGWSAAELTSRPSIEFVHPDDRDRTLAMRADILVGRPAREFENRYLCRDGSIRWLSWNVRSSLEVRQVFGVARDITERRAVEQQLRRAQRLESLATLAGGLAHDLNNVFAPILMAVDLLALHPDAAERAEILASLDSSARRGARLVGQVLSFARGVDGERVEVDLRHLLPAIVAETRAAAIPGIDIAVELAPDLRTVIGDPGQLRSVVHSLCENAAEAMPSGGSLRVTARNAEADAPDGAQAIAQPLGAHVVIEVADTGVGMTPDVMARIFDPFFTTRAVGKGSGLGLSSSLTIVQSHGGRIDVESAPGAGATFRVRLPAVPAPENRPAADVPQALAHGRGQLVLVVDDEASVRLMTRRVLEAGGYRTVVAADGAEALSIVNALGTEVALVITDMRMPVMDGVQTMAALRHILPAVPVIVACTPGEEAGVASVVGAGLPRCLCKPCTAEDLLVAVRDVLDSPH